MKQNASLTSGSILGPLISFTVPVLGAMILQAMYGAVDLLMVGKFGVAADISAVATGAQILHSLTGIIINLAVGTTVLIGQYIGSGRRDEAGRVIGGGILLFSAIGLVLTALVPLFRAPICRIMQTPAEAFEKTQQYVAICGLGFLFIVAYNLLGSIFRGIGDSKTPLLSVAIACVLNIAGDYYFVAVLGMAAAGAALATTLSQGISVLICIFVIKKRGLPFPFGKECFKSAKSVIRDTLRLGSPIALQELMVTGSFLVIMAIVNSLGVIASAGVGVAQKVCAFIMLVPSSFAQALSAFVAQNMGAGQKERAQRGLFYAIGVSFGLALIIAYVSFFHGNLLTGIFSDDPEVILAAWDYLRAYSIDVLLTSWMFCFVGYFNGCGFTRFVMLQGIVSAFFVRIPVSYFMSKAIPVSLFKIGLATPCSTALQIVLCVWYYRKMKGNQNAADK